MINEEYLYKVIRAPHVSEKATRVSSNSGQYVFRVLPQATKKEIKQAVETLFDVKVHSVQVVNIKSKETRNLRTNKKGRRSGYKKAYVGLAEGGHIDFLSEGNP